MTVCASVVLSHSAVADSTASGSWPLGGSFVVFDRIMPQSFWNEEIAQMASLGQKYIVLPGCGTLMPSSTDPTHYTVNPTTLCYPSKLFNATSQPDNLGMILTLADQYGMKVFVGSLYTYEADWTTGLDFSALQKFNPEVAQEIMQMYGKHASLGTGNWYFAQEIELNWVKAYGSTYYGITQLAAYVGEMKQINVAATVLCAPYFKQQSLNTMPGLTSLEAGMYLSILAINSNVSIVAPQDGAGAQAGAPPLSQLAAYYSSMKYQLPLSTKLWSTLETFQAVVPGSESANGWMPAPLGRIKVQATSEAPYVIELIEYMYGYDMSQFATYTPVEAGTLYNQYQFAYSSGEPETLGNTENVGLPVTYTLQPASTYPDTTPSKLTNGTGGGYNEVPTTLADWVGISTNNPLATEVTTVDLGPNTNKSLASVSVMYLGQGNTGILFPQAVSIDYQFYNDSVWHNLGTGLTVGAPTPTNFAVGWVTANTGGSYPTNVRYVRVTSTFSQWLFMGEVKVMSP